jgi:conjugal transfer pilus assembly protein TraF
MRAPSECCRGYANVLHRSLLVAGLVLVGGGAHADEGAGTSLAVPPTRSWWDGTPWGDPDRGFNWYPEPRPEAKATPEAKPQRAKTIAEMTSLEDVEKALRRLRGVAILNPTEDNVHEYLAAQQWVMARSSVFADTARRVVWKHPDVDYNARSPVANSARYEDNLRRARAVHASVADLGRDYGLLFVARADCPYCHDQAPILRRFERSYHMPVMAISLDGGPIPSFPDARADNGILAAITHGEGVQVVPAVFLVKRATNEAVPLGVGVIAADDLAERIRVLTRTEPGEEF